MTVKIVEIRAWSSSELWLLRGFRRIGDNDWSLRSHQGCNGSSLDGFRCFGLVMMVVTMEILDRGSQGSTDQSQKS